MPFIAPNQDPDHEPPIKHLEIDTGLGRRVMAWIGYVLLVLLVAAAFVALFVQFTGSMRLAIALVAIMMTYMTIMGIWASRDHNWRK